MAPSGFCGVALGGVQVTRGIDDSFPQLYWADGNLEQCPPSALGSFTSQPRIKAFHEVKKVLLQYPFCDFLVKKQLLRLRGRGSERMQSRCHAVLCKSKDSCKLLPVVFLLGCSEAPENEECLALQSWSRICPGFQSSSRLAQCSQQA